MFYPEATPFHHDPVGVHNPSYVIEADIADFESNLSLRRAGRARTVQCHSAHHMPDIPAFVALSFIATYINPFSENCGAYTQLRFSVRCNTVLHRSIGHFIFEMIV